MTAHRSVRRAYHGVITDSYDIRRFLCQDHLCLRRLYAFTGREAANARLCGNCTARFNGSIRYFLQFLAHGNLYLFLVNGGGVRVFISRRERGFGISFCCVMTHRIRACLWTNLFDRLGNARGRVVILRRVPLCG